MTLPAKASTPVLFTLRPGVEARAGYKANLNDSLTP